MVSGYTFLVGFKSFCVGFILMPLSKLLGYEGMVGEIKTCNIL